MKNIDQFIEGKFTLEDQDAYLQEILTSKFDAEYREKWTSKLSQLNVTRSPQKKTNRNQFLSFVVAIALFFLCFFSYKYFSESNTSPQHFAEQYLSIDFYSNPNTTKGNKVTLSKEYLSAAYSFNEKNWPEAQAKYEQLLSTNKINAEYKFYLALSYFYDKKFKEASQQFSTLYNLDTSDYRQEVNWFYGLSLYHDGQLVKANEVWSAIKKGEWKYDVVRNK